MQSNKYKKKDYLIDKDGLVYIIVDLGLQNQLSVIYYILKPVYPKRATITFKMTEEELNDLNFKKLNNTIANILYNPRII